MRTQHTCSSLMALLMAAATCLPVHAQNAQMQERIPFNQYKVHTNYTQQPQEASIKGMELTDAGGKTYSCITTNGQAYLLRKTRSTCDTLPSKTFHIKQSICRSMDVEARRVFR